MTDKQLPLTVNFTTAGLGGIMGWLLIHPINTLAVRKNLALYSQPSAPRVSLWTFYRNIVVKEGHASLYRGLSAGVTRQIFYATSRFGLFELFRDSLAKYRQTDFWSRLLVGCASGGAAALISCPAEVSLVRMSSDNVLPPEKRRGYTSVVNAASRIAREEGIPAFWRGCSPFVNRCVVVGACQVATYDQFREVYKARLQLTGLPNVALASFSAGFLYSFVTMPLETSKNRMVFQMADPKTGKLPYSSGSIKTIFQIAQAEGVFSLWNGYFPYYLRCCGHTVAMFIFVEQLRGLYLTSR